MIGAASFQQARLWEVEKRRGRIHVSDLYRLQGPLDVEALQRALNQVVQRHQLLRAILCEREQGLVNVIRDERPIQLGMVDAVASADDAVFSDAMVARLREEIWTPFDREHGPLVRATLFRRGHQDHVFVLTLCHVISDGESMQILLRDLAAYYNAFVAGGHHVELPKIAQEYTAYAEAQRQILAGPAGRQRLAFWRKYFDQDDSVTRLPGGHGGPDAGEQRTIAFGPTLYATLEALCQREGCTMFMLTMAAFALLLRSMAPQDHVTLGVPVSLRTKATGETVGYFVNHLALRFDAPTEGSVRDVLHQARATCWQALAHRDFPVLEALPNLPRDLFYRVRFNMFSSVPPTLTGLEVTHLFLDEGKTSFPLGVYLVNERVDMQVVLKHSAEVMDGSTAQLMVERFVKLLTRLAEDPQQRISQLEAALA